MEVQAQAKWLVGMALALAACSGSSGSPSNTVTTSNPCADGFAPASDGDGCVEVLPSGDCPAGTRAALGSTSCEKIAVIACPSGFAPDPSGWGCRDISPTEECAAGMIEELGNTACQPLGDCTAAFPPSAATLFVDDDTVTEDATHFKTISGAVVVAASGSTIAVESGNYSEPVEPHLPMTVVGRCASQVHVQVPTGGASDDMLAGFQTNGVAGGPVAVSGMSFTGFRGGIVEQDSDLTVTDVDIRDSNQSGIVAVGGKLHVVHSRSSGAIESGNYGFGAFISDGANALFENVALAENPLTGLAVTSKSIVKISQSVIRNGTGGSDGKAGAGIAIAEASTATIDACAVIANHSTDIEAYNAGTVVTVSNSVVRDAIADGAGNHGDGIALNAQSTMTVTTTTITGCAEAALGAIASGTTAHVSTSVILGYGTSPQEGIVVTGGANADLTDVAMVGDRDVGALAQDSGSSLTIDTSLVRDVVRTQKSDSISGNGVEISYGAALTMTDSTIYNAVQLGLGVGGIDSTGTGGSATITKVLIAHSVANENGDFGRGIQLVNGATLTANGSAILNSQESGVIIGESATADLEQTLIRGTGSIGPTTYGDGIIVLGDASITIDSSVVRDNADIAFAFSGGAGTINDTVIAHNPIAISADTTTLNDVDTPPSTVPPHEVYVSQTRFDDDATRVSSDAVPLPQVLQ